MSLCKRRVLLSRQEAAKCQVGESNQLEGSTLRRELLVTGSKLGPALKVPERARTLPPKSPQSSSEWPPTVSSPLLSCQRPTYRPHQSPRKAARPQAFLPPSKTFSLPPFSFIKSIFPLVARGHLFSPQHPHCAPNFYPKLRRFPQRAIKQPTRWLPSLLPTTMTTRRRSI